MQHDIRSAAPDGPFDLVLCRNLAFTYFDARLQRQTGEYIASVLHDGGLLVLGVHERLPHDLEGFAPWQVGFPIYRRVRSWHVTAGKRNAANLSSSHSRRNYEFETHRLRKR
jgi:chemotaxis methyl-accepting protein methylase